MTAPTKQDFADLVKNLDTKFSTLTSKLETAATTASTKHSTVYVPTMDQFKAAVELKSAADAAVAAHLSNLSVAAHNAATKTEETFKAHQESLDKFADSMNDHTKVLGDDASNVHNSLAAAN